MIALAIGILVVLAILSVVYFKRTAVERMKAKGDAEGLIKVLKHEGEDARRRAARALVEIGDLAVEPLIQAKHDRKVFQEEATKALVEIGEPAVAPLIQALKDKNVIVRFKAAKALGEIRAARAVDPLIQALKNEDRYEPEPLVEALGKIGRPAVEPLIHVLEDEDSIIHIEVAEALAAIGKPAVQPLIRALKDPSRPIRRPTAAQVFARILKRRGVEPILKALKDQDYYVRWAAADALGRMSSPELLIPFLKHGDGYVRLKAAESLGKTTDARAVAIWSEIASGFLPNSWPNLRRTRELMTEKNNLFEAQEPGALEGMRRINGELDDLMGKAVEDLQEAPTFLADVRASILKCYEIERKAFNTLSGII